MTPQRRRRRIKAALHGDPQRYDAAGDRTRLPAIREMTVHDASCPSNAHAKQRTSLLLHGALNRHERRFGWAIAAQIGQICMAFRPECDASTADHIGGSARDYQGVGGPLSSPDAAD